MTRVDTGPGVRKSVLFVTGVLRSGTTLLHRLLTHSLASEYVGEVDALHVIVESFQGLDRYGAFRPVGRAGYVSLYRRFLRDVSDDCAERMHGDVVVLKDPMALPTLRLFHELAPDAKFVVSVRHPLGTAASINRVRLRQRAQGRRSFIADMDFGDIVEYVARLGDVILDMRDEPNVHLVRYEDIVAFDPNVLADLGRFVGHGIDPNLPDCRPEHGPDHAFWTPEAGRPIQSSSLSKYEEDIGPDERALVAQLLERFSRSFGYGGPAV